MSVLSLEDILNTPGGKIIEAYYKTNNKLNDYYRQKLGDEIIRHELQNDVTKRKRIFPMWSHDKEIRICGPKKGTYRQIHKMEIWAGWTKGKSRQSAAGRGILLMRYYDMRRKLNKCGLTKVNAWKSQSKYV
ncbi:hypothetical protein ACJJTC_012120 [Scirpophaga incertulas]